MRVPALSLVVVLGLAACAGSDTPSAEPDAAAAAIDAGSDPADASPGADADTDAAPPAPAPATTLRVLSLNSWNKGAGVVASDILAVGADVVGLQEVTPAEVAAIVAALGDEWSFVQEDRANTFAIVSRYPILRRIGVTADSRGGIGATVAITADLRVHLFTTHLMYTPYGPYQLEGGMSVADVVASEEAVRMPALRQLLTMAAPHVTSDDPTFLIGDFNAPSHLDYAPAMPWPTSLAPAEAGFVDSYAELHPANAKKWACEFAIDDPGITWAQAASSEPLGCYDRIDFVYYAAGDAVAVESHEVNVASSDHRAVLTTFEVRPPVRAAKARATLAIGDARHALLAWTPAVGATSARLYVDDELVAETDASAVTTALLAPGTHTWRVDDGDTWTFTTRAGGGLEPSQRVVAPGAPIEIAFDGAHTAHDWIGLYARNAAYGSGSPATAWKYLNDTTTAPGSAVASGTLTIPAPLAAGEYVLRFFADDGYAVEDELTIRVE